MYAVFQIGGKQYRVIKNQVINVERIGIDVGGQVEFNKVLLIKYEEHLIIGNPFIENGKIIAKVIDQRLDQKIEIIKFRRRKHFRKFQGHRQRFTKIKIVNINGYDLDQLKIGIKENGT